jgi:hypothetical protein
LASLSSYRCRAAGWSTLQRDDADVVANMQAYLDNLLAAPAAAAATAAGSSAAVAAGSSATQGWSFTQRMLVCALCTLLLVCDWCMPCSSSVPSHHQAEAVAAAAAHVMSDGDCKAWPNSMNFMHSAKKFTGPLTSKALSCSNAVMQVSCARWVSSAGPLQPLSRLMGRLYVQLVRCCCSTAADDVVLAGFQQPQPLQVAI